MAYTIPITKNRIRASRIGAQTEDDYSDNIVNEYGELVLAGYDWAEGALDIQGQVAHDAADSGNPIKIGGKAHTGTPAAVANNDRVNAYFDEYGRLHVYDENGASAAAGDVAHDAVDSGNPVKIGFRARTSQISAVANDDRSDAVSNEYGEQVMAGHDWTLESNRVNETNPLSEQHAADEFEETIITANSTSYHYIDMGGYTHLTITGSITDGTGGAVQTVFIDATCQDDGTAPGSIAADDWIDITQYGVDWLTGVAGPVATSPNFGWALLNSSRVKYVRIRYSTAPGNNDAAHDIYARKTVL